MKSLFETLPKNVSVVRKKKKKLELQKNDLNISSGQSEEEMDISENRRQNMKNNAKLVNIIKKISKKNQINENNEINLQETQREHEKLFSNVNRESIGISNFSNEEEIHIISKEKKNFNLGETIGIFQDKNFQSNEDKTNKFFNIGQADNFSILNSYETLLNTRQKFTNDFFADSNVSFKNSFLRNMKNKTDFKNMKLIQNSFSQSTINVNEYHENSKSNNYFYRNSSENLQFNTVKNPFKSVTNYNFNHNFLKGNNINSQIFDIDEENYEEVNKNKTLNKVILNHLNKDSLEKTKRMKSKKAKGLKLNLEDVRGTKKEFIFQIEDYNGGVSKFPNYNEILPEKITEKISNEFNYNERYTEKTTEYKVVTEIIENINFKPDDFGNENINLNHSSLRKAESKEIERNQKEEFINSRDYSKIVNNQTPLEEINEIRYKQIAENVRQQSPEFLIKKKNFKLKISSKQSSLAKEKLEKRSQEKKEEDINNSKDSLFQTRVLKFNKKLNSSKKKRKDKNLSVSPLKEKEREDLINLNHESMMNKQNSNYQIHQNYNLSIINRREKIEKNERNVNLENNFDDKGISAQDFSYNNKNLTKSISNIFLGKQSSLQIKSNITKLDKSRKELKSHDVYSFENKKALRNKIFEDNKNLPEFCVINYDDNNNIIVKNKIEYIPEDYPPIQPRIAKLSRNGKVDLRNIYSNLSNEGNKLKSIAKHRKNTASLNTKSSNSNISRSVMSLNKQLSFPQQISPRNIEQVTKNSNQDLKAEDKTKKEILRKMKENSTKNDDEIFKRKKNSSDLFSNSNEKSSPVRIIDKNHFKMQTHAVIKSIADLQRENLETVEKKINEYVEEYNKQYNDWTFKKKQSDEFYQSNQYKENLRKMRDDVLKMNP